MPDEHDTTFTTLRIEIKRGRNPQALRLSPSSGGGVTSLRFFLRRRAARDEAGRSEASTVLSLAALGFRHRAGYLARPFEVRSNSLPKRGSFDFISAIDL